MVSQLEIVDLLKTLKVAGIELWVEDGRLKSAAPEGAMTVELRNLIRENLDTLVELLSKIPIKKTNSIFSEPIPLGTQQSDYILSNAQRRIWMVDQMETNLTAYNISGGNLYTLLLNLSYSKRIGQKKKLDLKNT